MNLLVTACSWMLAVGANEHVCFPLLFSMFNLHQTEEYGNCWSIQSNKFRVRKSGPEGGNKTTLLAPQIQTYGFLVSPDHFLVVRTFTYFALELDGRLDVWRKCYWCCCVANIRTWGTGLLYWVKKCSTLMAKVQTVALSEMVPAQVNDVDTFVEYL